MQNFKYYLIFLIILSTNFSFSMTKNKKKNKNNTKSISHVIKTEKNESILDFYHSMPCDLVKCIDMMVNVKKLDLPCELESKILKLDNKNFKVAYSIILDYIKYIKDVAILSDAEYSILNQLISFGISLDTKFFKLEPILCLVVHLSQVKGLVSSLTKYLEKAKKKYIKILNQDPNNYTAIYILLKVTVLLMHFNKDYNVEIVNEMLKKLYDDNQFIFYESVMPFNIDKIDILSKLIRNLLLKHKTKQTIYLLSSLCFASLAEGPVKRIIDDNLDIRDSIKYILDEIFSKKLKNETDYLLAAYFYNLIGQNSKALEYAKFLLSKQNNNHRKLFLISMLRDCFDKDEISTSIDRYTKVNNSLINKIN